MRSERWLVSVSMIPRNLTFGQEPRIAWEVPRDAFEG